MNPLAVLRRPRAGFAAVAADPRPLRGLVVVVLSGVASLALAVASNVLLRAGASGYVVAGLLPALFVAYWLCEAWLVDAGAGMVGRRGRRRTFLAVSAFAFAAWPAYALLSVAEAAALHLGGASGSAVASGIAWLTLPVLGWFVALTTLAVREVYDVPLLNALALALLPYAALMAAVLVLSAGATLL